MPLIPKKNVGFFVSKQPKKGGYSRSTHRIADIDYSEDYLLCICGWEGFAKDRLAGSEDFIVKKDYSTHRRKAPPVDEEFENKYRGHYATTVAPSKEKVMI